MALFNSAQNVFVVINQDDKKKEPLAKTLGEETLSKLATYGSFYTILHDCFTDGEGVEPIHRHLLLIGVDKKSANTWIEIFALLFDVPKNCIQIEAAKNPRKCGRYLVHRDDEWKYQFPVESVQTNNPKQLEAWMQGGKVTAKVLTTFKGGLVDFVQEFGAETTKRYWPLLEKIRSEQCTLSRTEKYKADAEWLRNHLLDLYHDLEDIDKIARDAQRRLSPGMVGFEAIRDIRNQASVSLGMLRDYFNNGVIDDGK